MRISFQLLGSCPPQNRDVGIRIFPECQKLLILEAGIDPVAGEERRRVPGRDAPVPSPLSRVSADTFAMAMRSAKPVAQAKATAMLRNLLPFCQSVSYSFEQAPANAGQRQMNTLIDRMTTSAEET